ncbi:unnamed protein product, partial [Prorocentrum cordatum]
CAWKRPPRLLRQREAANGRGARARSSWAARELPAATPQGPTPRGPIDRDPLFEPADASARGRPWQRRRQQATHGSRPALQQLLQGPPAAAARAPWRRAAGLEGLSSAHEAARELGEPPRGRSAQPARGRRRRRPPARPLRARPSGARRPGRGPP